MGELGCNFEVYRNDELTVEELKRREETNVHSKRYLANQVVLIPLLRSHFFLQ
ncbi:unnamed protein product [Brassica oleracea]